MLNVAGSASLSMLLFVPPAMAIGLESIDFPALEAPSAPNASAQAQIDKLDAADDVFNNSSTLKDLLAKSETNKAKNRKAVADKYCYRQAELGIGDCGGLRYIPGMTKSGQQKPPKWLADFLGIKEEESDQKTMTLDDLLGPQD